MGSALHDSPAGGLAVEFQQVDKRYGPRFAVRRLTLTIGSGECVALVGANGSGKTTLLKMAALLVRPTAGAVRFSQGSQGDTSWGDLEIKRRIGMVSHNILLYDELTAEENLTLFARLYGLDRAEERAVLALEPAGLTARRRDVVRNFSRGMRQRLAIARALLASPKLLLMDEAATGLDPAGQRWLGETLAGVRAAGCTIVMSTHGASEARELATRAVRLVAGVIAEDSEESGDPQGMLAAALASERSN